MKNFFGVVLIAVFLGLPMGVFAAPFTTQTMDVNASKEIAKFGSVSWYGDYDVVSNPLGGTTEVFCIEDALMWGAASTRYDFYTITVGNVEQAKYDELAEATWYANWFINSGRTELDKVVAQVAIWNAMGVATGNGGYSQADTLMGSYDGSDDYISDWVIAVSPANGGPIVWGDPGQNYLVQNPVPEPATMILFGLGLLGLARIGRKK